MKNTLSIAVTHDARARIAFEIALGLSKGDLPDGFEVSVAYGFGNSRLGGLSAPELLDQGEHDLIFVNPSPVTGMALKGLDPYKHKIDIRNLAVFPSWDRIGFAVKRSLGVSSLREIADRKIPLKLSTRGQGPEGTTDYTIKKTLNLCGWDVEDVQAWGGTLDRVSVPGHPRRLEGLRQNAYDAVFDEGIRNWADQALAQDMVFLPLEESVFAKMGECGFQRVLIPRSRFKGMEADVPALEFGGWPLFCRADLPEEAAYAVVKAIDLRKKTIPVDGDRLDMARICKDTEEGPYCIPLHPGAERYYREQGYL